MVKADIKHNYYADLDLPSNCTIDDIKKQYRKLALQYHPDRNAGKEEEFVPKFQAIQTAHEILGDAASKAKYDGDRRKAGLNAGAAFRSSGPTGNPYQATSAYPPPPRRTQPGTWQRPQPSASGAPPSGADRFSNFSRGAPTARKDPAQDRTNMFRAWQNMNNAADRQSRNTSGPTTPNRQRPPPPPRNDTRMPTEEEIKAGMNYRKGPPPRYEGDRTDPRQTAWAAFQQANTGKPGLSRSNTNRTPKKPGGFDPNAPGSDERPSTTGGYAHRHKSADFGRPGDEEATPFPPPPPPPRPQATPSPMSAGPNRFSDDEVPFHEANRVRTPYGGLGGEKTTFSSEGLHRSASSRDTSKLNPDSPSGTRARSTSPRRRQHGTKKSPIIDYSTSESSEDSSDPESAQPTSHPRSTSDERPGTAPANRPKATPSSRRPKQPAQNHASTAPSSVNPTGEAQNGNIFTYPVDHTTFASNNAKSRSAETIDTSFSPDGWQAQFTGTPDYFPKPSSKPSSRKASPAFRSRTQTHPPTENSGVPGFGAPTQPSEQHPQSAGQGGANFSKEEWEKTFKDASWTWPPPPPNPPASPSKGPSKSRSVSRKASKAGGKGAGTHDQPFVVDDDGEDVNLPNAGDAMDIDPPTAQQPNAPPVMSTPEPRLYSVPPSAWRQEQATAQSKSGRSTTDGSKLATGLEDLANVAPFARATDGLESLGDISASLPFPSQAAATLPTQPLAPQRLQIPGLPKAPDAPGRLTKESWQTYVQEFGQYMKAYHTFNTKMLQHFTARENQAQARMSAGLSWLGAVGETSTGFGGYLQGIREDEKVRETWVLGCERHKEATEALERVRDMVKRQVANGQLAER